MCNVCRIVALAVLFLTHVARIQAQFDMPPMALRAVAMGGSSTALGDASSALYSIAPLAMQRRTMVGIAYRQDFLLASTAHKHIALALPLTATGSLASAYYHYGNADYNEQHIALGYAQLITKRLAAGATIDYYLSTTSDGHYDPQHALSFTASLYAEIGDRWSAGLRVANAVFSKLTAQIDADIAYRPIPEWTTTLGIAYRSNRAISIHGGIEYLYQQHLAARIGLATNPLTYTFGFGYNALHYTIDFALQTHPILGLTPMIGGTIRL